MRIDKRSISSELVKYKTEFKVTVEVNKSRGNNGKKNLINVEKKKRGWALRKSKKNLLK